METKTKLDWLYHNLLNHSPFRSSIKKSKKSIRVFLLLNSDEEFFNKNSDELFKLIIGKNLYHLYSSSEFKIKKDKNNYSLIIK